MNHTTSFTVGRLLCGQVRDFLAVMRFQGYEIDWLEGSGWFQRTFTVKGSETALHTLAVALEDYKTRLDQVKS